MTAPTLAGTFPATSPTLLRAIAADPESPRWNDFARLYGPVVRRCLARTGAAGRSLGAADRDDLVQETFLAVARALPGFRYDPARGRFRGYLATVVRNLVLRRRREEAARPEVAVAETGEREAAPPTSDADRAMMLEVWTLALARVLRRHAFTPNVKAVFRAHVLDDRPVADVAAEFRMRPNAVYQVKDRVLRAVRRELAAFGQGRLPLADLHEALVAAEAAERAR
jgi:RNA polymerase sigma-70 factor (ECF subfamily)